MHPFPHRYHAGAAAAPTGEVQVTSPKLEAFQSAPPLEFGGPGDRWSPETLLLAAVADCFVLTFRAVARAARYEWLGLDVRVEGLLERPERQSSFTRFRIEADLRLPAGADAARGRDLLERAEHGCLISASLSGTKELVAKVEVAD